MLSCAKTLQRGLQGMEARERSSRSCYGPARAASKPGGGGSMGAFWWCPTPSCPQAAISSSPRESRTVHTLPAWISTDLQRKRRRYRHRCWPTSALSEKHRKPTWVTAELW